MKLLLGEISKLPLLLLLWGPAMKKEGIEFYGPLSEKSGRPPVKRAFRLKLPNGLVKEG